MPSYVDESGRTRWTRIVYVIELEPDACADKRSPCKGARCGRTPVYVGQTCHTAQERFDQHRCGYKASRWVEKYGLAPTPDLADDYGEMATTVESEAAERELARKLRKHDRGLRYCVYGGR